MNKKIILLLLLSSIICISCDNSTEPDLNSETPTLILKKINSDNTKADFTIINSTDENYYYFGFSNGYLPYALETKTDTGWVYCGPGWCGTGMEDQLFRSNSKFNLEVDLTSVTKNSEWRLFATFTKENSDEVIEVKSKTYFLK